MNWIGKIVGALIGLYFTHSFWGAVIGVIVGHLFDAGSFSSEAPSAASTSGVFFRTTFKIMGHVAKSDGLVSEAEIRAARRYMQEIRLDAVETERAIGYFTAGKSPTFDLEGAILELRRACGGSHDLLWTFVGLQVEVALAGNGLSEPARTILRHLAERVGISGTEFAYIEAAQRARQDYRSARGSGANGANGAAGAAGADGSGPRGAGARNSNGAGRGGADPVRGRDLAAYYAELGVDATVSNPDIVKAYRRQMSRHHPDKLVANGLPESMAQVAKEKTQRIQEAYEEIRAARGMR
jgi:DnaJ like chaperone protein